MGWVFWVEVELDFHADSNNGNDAGSLVSHLAQYIFVAHDHGLLTPALALGYTPVKSF